MRKYCITANTDISYNIYDNLIIIGKTKINMAHCKNISFINNKIVLEVEKHIKKRKNDTQKKRLW